MAQPVSKLNTNSGFTLIEAAIVIAIMAVMGIGISGMVRNAVDSQISQRTQTKIQLIANILISDIRRDMQTASGGLSMPGGTANTLAITTPTEGNVEYRYVSATQLQRWVNGTLQKTYNTMPQDDITYMITCTTPCFRGFENDFNSNMVSSASPSEVVINELQVATTLSNGIMDNAFGGHSFRFKELKFYAANNFKFDPNN